MPRLLLNKGAKMNTLNVQELKNFEDNRYTLIHVLPEEHYENLHIKGSINICVYEANFFDRVKELNLSSQEKVVLYGDSDNELDAKAAASKLNKLGFENIYVLEGGLSACIDVLDLEGEAKELDPDQLVSLDDRVYTLVTGSTMEWTGANANGKHFGNIMLKSGTLEVKDSLLSGRFVIDMSSIRNVDLSVENGSYHLAAHLKSDDFFLSKVFPEAAYSFKNIAPVQKPYQTDVNYVVDGELTLKGTTKKQRINALISKFEDGVVLNARVEIDRTRWGVIYGSSKFYKYLGMHKIFDNIYLEMRLELL
ncbi:MAG: hypothetical protein GQ474_01245 [Sulfurimonas sp.]|nr:hypothetical protein [Sulfurimonas sp.]